MKRFGVVGVSVALSMTGCAFQGLNSLPLPGAPGRGPDAQTYTVQVPNVATLESNSPVMIDDVVVGSVGTMTVDDWHANIEISVKPGVVVPANAVATIGQTSLLGSMHLALNPPLGEEPNGRLQPGATLPLNASSVYPTTERTLASLSTVANGGGLGQVGDIIHSMSTGISGRENEIRELLTRLDNFVGVLEEQRGNIVASMQQLRRAAGTFADQRDVIDRALKEIPPAIDVLIEQRPNFTTALQKLGEFSDTAEGLVNDAGDDLVKNLDNLGPILGALADIGPDLNLAVLWATAFPYGPTFADRVTRGDYINLYATFDLTYPRLKKTLLLGTRWGDEEAKLIPAPGDPYYLNYSYDPLRLGVAPPPDEALPPTPPVGGVTPPLPSMTEPTLPVTPPPPATPWLPQSAPITGEQIFAGPFGAQGAAESAVPAAPAPGGGG
ncbi:MCE family protein [Mycobacterium sp. pV006]